MRNLNAQQFWWNESENPRFSRVMAHLMLDDDPETLDADHLLDAPHVLEPHGVDAYFYHPDHHAHGLLH